MRLVVFFALVIAAVVLPVLIHWPWWIVLLFLACSFVWGFVQQAWRTRA